MDKSNNAFVEDETMGMAFAAEERKQWYEEIEVYDRVFFNQICPTTPVHVEHIVNLAFSQWKESFPWLFGDFELVSQQGHGEREPLSMLIFLKALI